MIKLAYPNGGHDAPFNYESFDFSDPGKKLPVVRQDIAKRLRQLLADAELAEVTGLFLDVDSLLDNHRLMDRCIALEEQRMAANGVTLRLMWNYYKSLKLVMTIAA
jgi:hypothetical protein